MAFLVSCAPGSRISYSSSGENVLISIREIGRKLPVFELCGDGTLRVRRDPFGNEVEMGRLTPRQVGQVLEHIINKLKVEDLRSSYPRDFISGIEMYPNMDLVLEVCIDGFEKRVSFAYSNICNELKHFLEEGRIDQQAYGELCRLKNIVEYLMKYKF